jgi:3'-phosphoadenosine 5'-phosphosulfate (PAPS) 3'-phosphatase
VAGKLGEWDTCAPEILLIEAGGMVTDFNGNMLAYGNEDHKLKTGTLFIHPSHEVRALEAIQAEGLSQ